ncbi:Uncharacterised protein [Legionella birminghamensis]|uniref:Uncharacterized protein n=1 Tax=Legionella birminghamensis TaxID=28083 RepID=A0A378IBW3_9GAMM|nr:Uncharacterised protein [Legionella birminghamensis]
MNLVVMADNREQRYTQRHLLAILDILLLSLICVALPAK